MASTLLVGVDRGELVNIMIIPSLCIEKQSNTQGVQSSLLIEGGLNSTTNFCSDFVLRFFWRLAPSAARSASISPRCSLLEVGIWISHTKVDDKDKWIFTYSPLIFTKSGLQPYTGYF